MKYFKLGAALMAMSAIAAQAGNDNNGNSATLAGIGGGLGLGAGLIDTANGLAAGIGAAAGLGAGIINVNGNGNDNDHKYNNGNSNNGGLLGNLLGGNSGNSAGSLTGIGIGGGIGLGAGIIKADSGDDSHKCPTGQYWNGHKCVQSGNAIKCNGGTIVDGQCVCTGDMNIPVEDTPNCYTCVPKCQGGVWGGGYALPTSFNADQCMCNNPTDALNVPIFDADDCRYQCLPQCVQAAPYSGSAPPPAPTSNGICTCENGSTVPTQIPGENRYECLPFCENGTFNPDGTDDSCTCPVATTKFPVPNEMRVVCVDNCEGGSWNAAAGICTCSNGQVAVQNTTFAGTYSCECPEGSVFIDGLCASLNCRASACDPYGANGICADNMVRDGDRCVCPSNCEWLNSRCHRRCDDNEDWSEGRCVARSGSSSSNNMNYSSSDRYNNDNDGRNNDKDSGSSVTAAGIGAALGGGLGVAVGPGGVALGVGAGAGIGAGVINASQNDGRRDRVYSAGKIHTLMQAAAAAGASDAAASHPVTEPSVPAAADGDYTKPGAVLRRH
jgi:hypothetical protein